MSDLDETLKPLMDMCSPLRIAVKLRKNKDKYYIDFDGSKTYTNVEHWITYWGGFEEFAKHVLMMNNFKYDKITLKNGNRASAFIGTLFDLLVKTHD